jgi:hypothetical protein
VEVVGAAVDELGDERGELAAGGPLGGQVADLLLRGDLAGEEEPEETLGEGLGAAGSLGEDLLALGDGLATEADTLLGVEDGALPDEGLDATGTTVDLVEGDLADNLGTVLLLEGLDLLDLLGEAGSEGLLEGLERESGQSGSIGAQSQSSRRGDGNAAQGWYEVVGLTAVLLA